MLGILGAPGPGVVDSELVIMPGLRVREIQDGSALERAGVEAGDVILRWDRLPNPPQNPETESGKLIEPSDWYWLEIEQAPRGTIRLTGERGGSPYVKEVGFGPWDATVEPRFVATPIAAALQEILQAPPTSLELERESLAKLLETVPLLSSVICWLDYELAKRYPLELTRHFQEISELAPHSGLEDHRSIGTLEWLITTLKPEASADAGELARGNSSFACRVYAARLLDHLGTVAYERGDIAVADELFLAVLDLGSPVSSDSLFWAQAVNNLGAAPLNQGNFDLALKNFSDGLNIRRRHSPGHSGEADSFANVAVTLILLGKPGEAEGHLKEAVEIYSRLGIENGSVANVMSNYALLLEQEGRLLEAREVREQVVSIWRRMGEHGVSFAASLNNLGNLLRDLGEVEAAEELLREAVGLLESTSPDGIVTAHAMKSLGALLQARYDWDGAQLFLSRALGIYTDSGVGSSYRGDCLNSLGLVSLEKGELEKARDLFRAALDVYQGAEVEESNVSVARSNLAVAERQLGNLAEAKRQLAMVLEIDRRTAPSGLRIAKTFHELGFVAEYEGEPDKAAEWYQAALDIKTRLAPGSETEASTWSRLGRVRRVQGDLSGAEDALQQSTDALADQVEMLGRIFGSREAFMSNNVETFRELISLQVARGAYTEAFRTTERFRGRVFLIQLAERPLLFAETPPDLVASRDRLAVKYDRNLIEVQRLCAVVEQASACSSLRQEAVRLRDELSHREAEILASSPRLAALRSPRALDLLEARTALDQGTLVLSYVTGEEKSYLFALSPGVEITVYEIPVSETEIHQQVERFRKAISLVRRRSNGRNPWFREQQRLGKALYNQLLAPAADLIASADRVLILADGSLHYLPFAALIREVRSADGQVRDEYLAEWKPLYSALSVNVFAKLKKQRRDRVAGMESDAALLAAFGDPLYSRGLQPGAAGTIAEYRLRAVARRRIRRFKPLPFTRREVDRIGRLFPPSRTRVFMGSDATEERVFAIGPSAQILHFATHAYVDEHVPLNSALVLTLAEQSPEDNENGLLQVWEILERLRLDADLVILSGCETALGEERGGEGLVGLTRAFQFAGARSVIASLWSVQDQATAELMIRFYKHFQAGATKDVALQRAQIELIRGPIEVVDESGDVVLLEASPPFYWAGFQVYGDWQ